MLIKNDNNKNKKQQNTKQQKQQKQKIQKNNKTIVRGILVFSECNSNRKVNYKR